MSTHSDEAHICADFDFVFRCTGTQGLHHVERIFKYKTPWPSLGRLRKVGEETLFGHWEDDDGKGNLNRHHALLELPSQSDARSDNDILMGADVNKSIQSRRGTV
jgi:hypothetical protein